MQKIYSLFSPVMNWDKVSISRLRKLEVGIFPPSYKDRLVCKTFIPNIPKHGAILKDEHIAWAQVIGFYTHTVGIMGEFFMPHYVEPKKGIRFWGQKEQVELAHLMCEFYINGVIKYKWEVRDDISHAKKANNARREKMLKSKQMIYTAFKKSVPKPDRTDTIKASEAKWNAQVTLLTLEFDILRSKILDLMKENRGFESATIENCIRIVKFMEENEKLDYAYPKETSRNGVHCSLGKHINYKPNRIINNIYKLHYKF